MKTDPRFVIYLAKNNDKADLLLCNQNAMIEGSRILRLHSNWI